ncbi:MAG TPA: hypothetical protein VK463_21245, partial [Desulfomonilaceae bacterium]|nr:hypothetical protein [Desulfomonilaceae bacterium]
VFFGMSGFSFSKKMSRVSVFRDVARFVGRAKGRPQFPTSKYVFLPFPTLMLVLGVSCRAEKAGERLRFEPARFGTRLALLPTQRSGNRFLNFFSSPTPGLLPQPGVFPYHH